MRFPQAGTWRYVVDDGFTMRHSYPPVQIATGGRSAATGRRRHAAAGPIAYDRLALAALAGLAAAGLALLPRVAPAPRRRPRREPDPARAAARSRPACSPRPRSCSRSAARQRGGEARVRRSRRRQPAGGRACSRAWAAAAAIASPPAAAAARSAPRWTRVLASYDAASLRAKIVDPYPAGDPTDFSAMPQDFGRG